MQFLFQPLTPKEEVIVWCSFTTDHSPLTPHPSLLVLIGNQIELVPQLMDQWIFGREQFKLLPVSQ